MYGDAKVVDAHSGWVELEVFDSWRVSTLVASGRSGKLCVAQVQRHVYTRCPAEECIFLFLIPAAGWYSEMVSLGERMDLAL